MRAALLHTLEQFRAQYLNALPQQKKLTAIGSHRGVLVLNLAVEVFNIELVRIQDPRMVVHAHPQLVHSRVMV